MAHDYDVIIAGAGPVGLYMAGLLEKRLRVLVLEEHKKIGRPPHCSGLVSTRLAEFVPISREWIEHEVRGCVLHSPGGKELALRKPRNAAYVIDREKFDRWLASTVESKIMMGLALEGYGISPEGVKVKTSKGIFSAKALVGCDGANSMVARLAGVKRPRALKGIIAIEGKESRSDSVDLYFDRRVCPDGFLWRIPRGKTTEYGMMSQGAYFTKLERFFGLCGKTVKMGGIIPIGKCRVVFDRVMICGDAAMQVKPWSGGGVIFGFSCAEAAARALLAAAESGNFSRRGLVTYGSECNKLIGKQVERGLLFRRLYGMTNNTMLDLGFGLLKAPGVRGILESIDMDFPV